MKTLYKNILVYILTGLFISLSCFVLYKAAASSHARCKAVNTTYEDYRFCMNI
jgi:hypothetical protein